MTKREKVFQIIGIIIGIAMIIVGMVFLKSPEYNHGGGYTVPDYSFGADFYTEIYNAARAAAGNAARATTNIEYLGDALAKYVGAGFIFAGLLVALKHTKSLVCAGAAPSATAAPVMPAVPQAQAVSQPAAPETAPAPLPTVRICRKCGCTLSEGAAFCMQCGTAVIRDYRE